MCGIVYSCIHYQFLAQDSDGALFCIMYKLLNPSISYIAKKIFPVTSCYMVKLQFLNSGVIFEPFVPKNMKGLHLYWVCEPYSKIHVTSEFTDENNRSEISGCSSRKGKSAGVIRRNTRYAGESREIRSRDSKGRGALQYKPNHFTLPRTTDTAKKCGRRI